MTKATDDIIQERVRQQAEEGWTLEHDDAHGRGQLARAAAAYALHATHFRCMEQKAYRIKAPQPNWPWGLEWWKPKDSRRDLVRAGALIVAEIERLDRMGTHNENT